EIQREMEKGTITEMKPINFFINLFSLMAYPFVARPIYLKMFDLTDNGYTKLLVERKKGIVSMIFNK
ncbi:MAG: TetR/AcrR family transcriptional regulator, partial [Segetibacter sp.]